MVDYYKVLGVPRNASQAEIKSSFKKLALQYHPDRNPDNQFAEEMFKEVNRAYQVLSDPYKRHQHDLILEYQNSPPRPYRTTYQPFYYPPYAKSNRPPKGEYQYGWAYFKTQFFAFAFVFVVALLVMGVKYSYDQYRVGKEVRLAEMRAIKFKDAQDYFDKGEYRVALDIIMDMYQKNKTERSIREYRDKFVGEVLDEAENQFSQKLYQSALINFTIVSDYQRISNPKVYLKMADCQKALGDYAEAVKNLDIVLLNDQDNLMLNFQIGSIYYDVLHQPEEAVPYYDRARKRVKQILTQTYGHAAELVMNPKTSPQIYYDVFFARAKVLTITGDHEEAIKDCNWSVFLHPEIAEPYYLRGVNYHEIGKDFKACKNWNEAEKLGYVDAKDMLDLYCQ